MSGDGSVEGGWMYVFRQAVEFDRSSSRQTLTNTWFLLSSGRLVDLMFDRRISLSTPPSDQVENLSPTSNSGGLLLNSKNDRNPLRRKRSGSL